MTHRFAILLAASIGLLAAPALGGDAPGGSAPIAPAAPPAAAPPPSPMYAPPPWAYGPPGGYVTPPPRPTLTERYSTPMMATGIALVSGGVTGLLIGATVFANKSSCVVVDLPPDAPAPDRCPQDPHHFIGGTIMIASSVIAALGIPLWVAGAGRVPIDGESHARLGPLTASASPRLAPLPTSATLLLGPMSTGIRLTF